MTRARSGPRLEFGAISAEDLAGCQTRDRVWLRRELGRLGRLRDPKQVESRLGELRALVARSVAETERRRQRCWPFEWPESLPISTVKDELRETLESSQVVVVTGSTGCGKSTGLPKLCLELGRGVHGMIGLTQPRRIAAREIASFLAADVGVELGGEVGFQVRFQDHSGPRTQVKVMTDGVLLAAISRDRLLSAYDTLIIDEVHERTVNIDVLLGYIRGLLPRRPDLRLILSSATADAGRWSSFLGGAPVIEVEGRTFEIETRWQPPATDDDPVRAVVDTVLRLSQSEKGDILAFLPGERDILTAVGQLRRNLKSSTEVLPLYARLTPTEQGRVFRPGPARRIVLATNVAETSLTVPRIRFVVDSGLARIRRYAFGRGVERLPIEPISQASADQRKGRCGRQSAGICIRLYSEADYLDRPRFTEPEIRRSSLPAVMLQLKSLGLGEIEEYPLLDPPEPKAIRDGQATLRELGAINTAGELTSIGRQLTKFPADPRIARMIVEGSRRGCLHDILVVAAFLAVEDPRRRGEAGPIGIASSDAAREKRSDFEGVLHLWNAYRQASAPLRSSAGRKLCLREGLSWVRMSEWQSVHRQLSSVARDLFNRAEQRGERDPAALSRSILAGSVTRVGRRVERREYEGPRGISFELGRSSALGDQRPKWVVVSEIVETRSRFAAMVAEIDPQWVAEAASSILKRSVSDARWDPTRGVALCSERTSLYGMELPGSRRVRLNHYDPVEARRLFLDEGLARLGVDDIPAYLRPYGDALERIRSLEDRLRRRDLLLPPQARAEWFSARVPGEIFSFLELARWTDSTAMTTREDLLPTDSDLMAYPLPEDFERKYPCTLKMGVAAAELHYVFDPLNEADGVTVRLPLAIAAAISTVAIERAVPGWLPDLVEGYWGQLPRAARAAIRSSSSGNAPVASAVGYVSEASELSVAQALAGYVGRFLPQFRGASAFEGDRLPVWLAPRVEVVDDKGAVLICGRDSARVLDSVRSKARVVLGKESLDPGLVGQSANTWIFGQIEPVLQTAAGVEVYPAIGLNEGGACLAVFESEEKAALAHCEGLRFLLRHACSQQEKVLQGNAHFRAAALLAMQVGGGREFQEAILDLSVADAFELRANREVMSLDAFEDLLRRGRARVVTRGEVWSREMRVALVMRQGILDEVSEGTAIGGLPAGDDLRSQLARLFQPGFLSVVPAGWLAEFSRYLEAAERRVAKLKEGNPRDGAAMEVVQRFEQRLSDLGSEGLSTRIAPFDVFETYRWWVEEFRVSLFAQELGTKVPVSPKRLDREWERALAEYHGATS